MSFFFIPSLNYLPPLPLHFSMAKAPESASTAVQWVLGTVLSVFLNIHPFLSLSLKKIIFTNSRGLMLRTKRSFSFRLSHRLRPPMPPDELLSYPTWEIEVSFKCLENCGSRRVRLTSGSPSSPNLHGLIHLESILLVKILYSCLRFVVYLALLFLFFLSVNEISISPIIIRDNRLSQCASYRPGIPAIRPSRGQFLIYILCR